MYHIFAELFMSLFTTVVCCVTQVRFCLLCKGTVRWWQVLTKASVVCSNERRRHDASAERRRGQALALCLHVSKVWVGVLVVTKFLLHLCVSKDELPVKHSEKLQPLTVIEFPTNYKRFCMGAVLFYIPQRSKFVCFG
jgi:hypothetical protein